jgi:hypothetical protein
MNIQGKMHYRRFCKKKTLPDKMVGIYAKDGRLAIPLPPQKNFRVIVQLVKEIQEEQGRDGRRKI